VVLKICIIEFNTNRIGNVRIKANLRRVRVTTVAVEEQ